MAARVLIWPKQAGPPIYTPFFGRRRDRDLKRGGEANGREIEKGWNDRETTERGEDDRETEREVKKGLLGDFRRYFWR